MRQLCLALVVVVALCRPVAAATPEQWDCSYVSDGHAVALVLYEQNGFLIDAVSSVKYKIILDSQSQLYAYNGATDSQHLIGNGLIVINKTTGDLVIPVDPNNVLPFVPDEWNLRGHCFAK